MRAPGHVEVYAIIWQSSVVWTLYLMCNSFPVEASIIHEERMQVNRAAHRLRTLLEAEVVAVHHTLEIL